MFSCPFFFIQILCSPCLDTSVALTLSSASLQSVDWGVFGMCRGSRLPWKITLAKLWQLSGPKVEALDKCFIRFIDAWVMKELRGMEKRLDSSRFFHTEGKKKFLNNLTANALCETPLLSQSPLKENGRAA